MAKTKKAVNPATNFVIKFVCLFALLYGFYIFYLSITSPGGRLYSNFLSVHLNFVAGLRHLLIGCSAGILNLLGYQTKTNDLQMLVVGHNTIYVGYDCLGFGVMSFFTAFVFSYPGRLRPKLYFYFVGLVVIQLLNLLRFMLLALYWKHTKVYISDHHTIYNLITYILIGISIYFYARCQTKQTLNAAN